MGKVYLAANQKDGMRVAIKVLPPSKAADGGQALLRFRREMELSRRANHPNLARTIDVGQAGDVHFMVLEYVPGESLYQLVKQPRGGPLRVPDAARFFLKVLDGLEAAHEAGLIHRDIKPSNLMVTPDGDARILDLGLARARSDEESPLTRPNVVIGTLDYASPEQLGNAAQADRRSDLYSLGCTLYFALAGPAPVRGGRRRQQDLQAADGRPRAPGAGGPGRPLGVRGDRPQADGQGPRRPLPGLRGAAGRPRPVGRPGGRPRDPRRRGRRRPRLPAAPPRARRRRPPAPGRRRRRSLGISLRDLGAAEAPAAPMHRAAPAAPVRRGPPAGPVAPAWPRGPRRDRAGSSGSSPSP